MLRGKLATLVVAFGISTLGFAKSTDPSSRVFTHEFLVGGPSIQALGSLVTGVPTTGAISFSSDVTSISGTIGYNYTLMPMLQLGGRTMLSYNSLFGSSLTVFSIVAGPTFNLIIPGFNERNAFFLGGYLGITTLSGGGGTKFTFGFDLGKRFAINDTIAYRPAVGIQKLTDSAMTFSIFPIAFSAMF